MRWNLLLTMLFVGSAYGLPLKKGMFFKRKIPGQFIIKRSNLMSLGAVKKIRTIGKGHILIESYANKVAGGYPNYEYFGYFLENNVPNDERFGEQFHHEMIKTTDAWTINSGVESIVIAVTDNEFELDHDDLKDSWFRNKEEIPGNGIDDDGNGYIDDNLGWDFMGKDNDVRGDVDEPTHGTHVSGIIAAQANNKVGVVGVAPGVKVMPLKWYGGEGRWTSAIVAETYYYAVDNGANIISTSYNIDALVDDQAYLDALAHAKDNGVLVVNSAGNSNEKDPARSKLEDVVLVCSVKSKKKTFFSTPDKKSRFSNYGEGIDICAPGDPILSTVQGEYMGGYRYGELQGTSMAAPIVAAVAGLIWSEFPYLSLDELKKRLLQSVDDISEQNGKLTPYLGSGRINALKALR